MIGLAIAGYLLVGYVTAGACVYFGGFHADETVFLAVVTALWPIFWLILGVAFVGVLATAPFRWLEDKRLDLRSRKERSR